MDDIKAPYLFSSGFFEQFILFSKKKEPFKESAIIDTNYLTRINRDDFLSMLFDPNYEETKLNHYKMFQALTKYKD